MSTITVASLEAIPQLFMLVAGILGVIFSVTGRRRGVSGLMLAAFAVMLVAEAGSLSWNFVSLDSTSLVRQYHLNTSELNAISLSVGLPISLIAATSWLLVALAVNRVGRPPRPTTPTNYYAPTNYPMPTPPGFVSSQPTYAQPTHAQPEQVQPAGPQAALVQPEPVQPGPVQPDHARPNLVQPTPPQPGPTQPTSAPTAQPPAPQPPNQQ